MTNPSAFRFIPAVLCYVKRDGKTLMLRRDKGPGDLHAGKWNGLGGKLERGESPEDAAAREVFEESGLVVKSLRYRGFLCFPGFDGTNDWHVWVYVIRDFEGVPFEKGPEGTLHWIPDGEVAALNLWGGDRHFLPWLDEGPTFSARFEYEKGEYLRHSVVFHPAS